MTIILKKLSSLHNTGVPICKMVADHKGDKTAQCADSTKAWGLHPVIYMAQGAKVMLRINVLQKFGLVNGSQGTVVDILHDEESYNRFCLPKAIIVDFKNYKGPALFKDHPTYVPIVPFHASWVDSKQRTRTQIPLDLSWAMTIHKSQGLTLERAVIDLGNRENPCGGITFVALSRLKTFDGLFLKPMTYGRIEQINGKVMLQKRREEEKRLHKLYEKLQKGRGK